MILFLYGNDSLRLSERLKVLRAGFTKKFDTAGLSSATIAGSAFTLADFHSHTQTGGLFAEKRFCVVQDVWDLSADDQKALAAALDAVPADTIVVVCGANPPRKNNALFKRLLQADTVEEYIPLTGAALRQWIEARVALQSATIESAAIDLLIQRFGDNSWALDTEIHKLAAYTTSITADSVNQFSTAVTEDNIFALTDALGAKNVVRATQLLEDQFELDNHPQYIITMLARHFGTLAKVKKTGGTDLGIHPYVLEKSTAQARQFETTELLRLHQELLSIDTALKTGNQNPSMLLNLFIADACA